MGDETNMHVNGPPGFPGAEVGSRLHELEGRSAPWTAARAVTAPGLTQSLLAEEPGFTTLTPRRLADVANSLTFLFQHTKAWTLLWAESVAGPARFEDSRKVRCGAAVEKTVELARTAGIKVGAKGDIWALSASAELSARWSELTQSMVRIETETEFTRILEFPVPSGGMDIALWQLESRLTRRLILRPGAHLPDPVPEWAETAIAVPVRSTGILTSITKSMTRAVPGSLDDAIPIIFG